MTTPRRLLGTLASGLLAVAAVRRLSRARRPAAAASHGARVQRPRSGPDADPVVQHLTYVRSRRRDGSHLLFVGPDDLDAMAAAADEPAPVFLERLDQLGVVVCPN